MSEDLLRRVAAELNETPGAAERASRYQALVAANNTQIAAEAIRNMPFDASPYAYQSFLAAMDKR